MVIDSKGDADGNTVNVELSGAGALVLAGADSDEYASLPAGLLSGLTDATFEAWITWTGSTAWERIFDFGSNDGPDGGAQGTTGTTYLFLTPLAPSGAVRVAYRGANDTSETVVDGGAAVSSGMLTHVAVVVNDTANTLSLYLDGVEQGSVAFNASLADITDDNNWLGRSQFSVDPEFSGTLHEFRVYGSALSSALLQMSFSAGPDAP
jgi:hypothetical protein